MTFQSILYLKAENRPLQEILEAPACLADLSLDQVINAITAGRTEYQLAPFYYAPLQDPDAIQYRQEVMRELENKTLFDSIQTFAVEMCAMRRYLALGEASNYRYQQAGWFFEAVDCYCAAVSCLEQDLARLDLQSRGLVDFREFLKCYTESAPFMVLHAEAKRLRADLSTIKYSVLIKNNTVKVRKYDQEPDYSLEVEQTFEKFKQSPAKDDRVRLPSEPGMHPVEAKILDCVAQLYPAIFLDLDQFCTRHRRYQDEALRRFDREIQFYIAYLEYIAIFKRAELPLCYPQISRQSKEIYAEECFDLALAANSFSENIPIVCNHFSLKDPERTLVITGPNQGGKTTFARMFGQVHYLAALGCPVAGRTARLFLFDQVFTHFEKDEDIQTLQGKLQSELLRMHVILAQATPNSLIILNEIFTSTTLTDALFLSKQVLGQISGLDLLCVCVTFIDELAALNEKTVSLMSTVVSENPALRTYQIVRKPADGLSHARSIAEKHRLTYDALKERIRS